MMKTTGIILAISCIFSFSIHGQERDTLSYFNPDSTEACAYIGDLTDMGVLFEPKSDWGNYNVIALELQHISTEIVANHPISFHSYSESFPGDTIDTLWVSRPDSIQLYPSWISYDLSERSHLQNISGALSVTGSPLLSFLCDFSSSAIHSWGYSYQQQLWHPGGNFPIRAIIERVPSSIHGQINTPQSFAIEMLYPNPFNPSLVIAFRLDEKSEITISAFDVLGTETTISQNQVWEQGRHRISWHPDHEPAGVYFIVVKSSTQQRVEKCIFLK